MSAFLTPEEVTRQLAVLQWGAPGTYRQIVAHDTALRARLARAEEALRRIRPKVDGCCEDDDGYEVLKIVNAYFAGKEPADGE